MATQNIYALSDTWNAGGTTFTAIKMNVTDTASAAGSLLIDLQVGGVSQFKVSKAGAVTAVGVAIPTISSSDTLSNKTLSSPTLSGTVAGAVTASGAWNFSAAATPNASVITLNATDSFGIKLRQQDNGVLRGYIGSDATYCFVAFNSSGVGVFDVSNAGAARVNSSEVATAGNTLTLSNKTLSGVTIADATNIVLNTTTGTKIGTATNQKLGFFNQTPVVQPTAVADATNAVDVITQLNALLTRMRNLGLIAT